MILYRAVEPSPAKLAYCDWSQPHLTIQDPPRWQGDAIEALNLRFYCLVGHFRFLPIYRDFYRIFLRFDSFTREEGGRFVVHRPGLHAPAPGLAFRLMRAALNWSGWFMRGAHLSDSMRHRGISFSFISSAFHPLLEFSISSDFH